MALAAQARELGSIKFCVAEEEKYPTRNFLVCIFTSNKQ